MMDSLPGVRIGGENNNEIAKIRDMVDNVARNKEFIFNGNQRTSWGHNRVPKQSYACVSQKMMETINPPKISADGHLLDGKGDDSSTIIGTKTIRFADGLNEIDIPALVDFMKDNFPCARYVVNYRSNTTQQSDSRAKLKFDGEDRVLSSADLDAENERLIKIGKMLDDDGAGGAVKIIDSEIWTRDSFQQLNEIVDWLGFNEECHFTEMLKFNTQAGYRPQKIRIRNMNPNCRYRYHSDDSGDSVSKAQREAS